MKPALRKMLAGIASRQSPPLELQLVSSGGRSGSTLAALIAAGYAARVDDPHVKDRRTGGPATAIAITDAGRKALENGR